MDPIFFDSTAALREWLLRNHDLQSVLFVGLYKKGSGRAVMSREEIEDEFFCFGWTLMGIKRIDELSYMVRYCPRKKGSRWSPQSIEKALLLIEAGIMEPSGIELFKQRSTEPEHEHLDKAYETEFKKHPAAWAYFQELAPTYYKGSVRWVMKAKQEATRQKRLKILIECSEEGEKIPAFQLKRK